jgi:phosphoribosylamine-glycine ligase
MTIKNIEKLEQEIASNSYLASQHEENEMVIKSSRVLEILGENSKEIKELIKEMCEYCKGTGCKMCSKDIKSKLPWRN